MQELWATHYAPVLGAATHFAVIRHGLINRTYLVTSTQGQFILQQLNAMFDPVVHEDIYFITTYLQQAGVVAPILLKTCTGHLYVRTELGHVFRVYSALAGETHHRILNQDMAYQAGSLVGRFHAVMYGCDYVFKNVRPHVHDFKYYLSYMNKVIQESSAHPLFLEAQALCATINEYAGDLPALSWQHCLITHGDLKLSNLLFHRHTGEGLSLLDFDTLGRLPLAVEMGDAWRSWCNIGKEDDHEVHFSVPFFEASLNGYLQHYAAYVTRQMCEEWIVGILTITLELAARFTTDIVEERYFAFDETRYERKGAHHLVRARNQVNLFRSLRAQQREAMHILPRVL